MESKMLDSCLSDPGNGRGNGSDQPDQAALVQMQCNICTCMLFARTALEGIVSPIRLQEAREMNTACQRSCFVQACVHKLVQR
mmetsp:Transcript_82955/g.230425  ORF Transcript_82955/g.230425 Transcript_82955/m.230425 type:complete len:83 (-) Transcript_82955:7-255(-)